MTHKHHWLLEPQVGPMGMGRCACGDEREFRNSDPERKGRGVSWRKPAPTRWPPLVEVAS